MPAVVLVTIVMVELLDFGEFGMGELAAEFEFVGMLDVEMKLEVGLDLRLELRDPDSRTETEIPERLADEKSDGSSKDTTVELGDGKAEDKVIDLAEPGLVPILNKFMASVPEQQLRL